MDYSRLKERGRLLLRPFVLLYVRSGLHPNVLTLLGLFFSIVSAYLFANGDFVWAAVALLAGGMCDATDGEVARMSGRTTRFGAFLDSVLDRYSEIVVFLGIFVFYLEKPVAVFAVLALTGSLMVSYARARAEALSEDCRVGLLLRPERLALLIVGGFLGPDVFVYFLVAIAVLSNFTAIHRIYHTWRRISSNGKVLKGS